MKIQLIYKLTCTRIKADELVHLNLEAEYILIASEFNQTPKEPRKE